MAALFILCFECLTQSTCSNYLLSYFKECSYDHLVKQNVLKFCDGFFYVHMNDAAKRTTYYKVYSNI